MTNFRPEIITIQIIYRLLQNNNYRIPGLDGLRAISIIIVILKHLLSQKYLDSSLKSVPILFDGLFGVNVFFIISGFLITTLLLREEEKTGTVVIRSFYLRRVLRIFPAYFFLLFVYAILEYFNVIEISRSSWLTSLTFTRSLIESKEWFTGHTWSLSVEECFYLLWPILFLKIKKNRQGVLWLIIISVPLVRFLTSVQLIPTISELSLFTRADAIAMGCILAINRAKVEEKLFKEDNFFIYLFLTGLFILGLLSRFGVAVTLKPLSLAIGGTHGTIASLLICIILIFSTRVRTGWWHKFLNNKIVVYIGTLSYSLYLWQQFFINDTATWYNSFPINLVLIVICAMGSYHLIEKPFLKLKTLYSNYK